MNISRSRQAVLTGRQNGVDPKDIAAHLNIQIATVFKTVTWLRRNGYEVPPAKGEIPPKLPPPRFHANGVMENGIVVSCAADTQDEADAEVAWMVSDVN